MCLSEPSLIVRRLLVKTQRYSKKYVCQSQIFRTVNSIYFAQTTCLVLMTLVHFEHVQHRFMLNKQWTRLCSGVMARQPEAGPAYDPSHMIHLTWSHEEADIDRMQKDECAANKDKQKVKHAWMNVELQQVSRLHQELEVRFLCPCQVTWAFSLLGSIVSCSGSSLWLVVEVRCSKHVLCNQASRWVCQRFSRLQIGSLIRSRYQIVVPTACFERAPRSY